MIVPARRRHPRTFNYRITRRGGINGYSGYSGLGDCTPTSCPDGPYPGNDSANYDYFLNQTSTPDQQKAGAQTQAIPQAAVNQVIENALAPVPQDTYYDLLASAGGLRTCDPRDSSCTLYNEELQAAVENYWVTHGMNVPAGTKINFTPDLSQSAMLQYLGTPGTLQSGNVIASGSLSATPGPIPTPTFGTPGPGAAANVNKAGGGSGSSTPPPGTANLGPAPNVDLTGGGTSSGSSSSSSSGFSVSSIPWWGWAAAAGVALFAFGGKH